MNKSIAIVGLMLWLVSIPPVLAQSEAAQDPRAGYTCAQILKLKTDKWATVYTEKVKDGSEVGQDLAYEAYGECQKSRNDLALAKLPKPVARRIANYRSYFQELRIASLMLERGYAGGGTMYVHMARRNVVTDEELVASLIRLQPTGDLSPNPKVKTKLSKLRTKMRSLDPSLPKNRRQLAEFNGEADARKEYSIMSKNFESIARLLPTERPNVSALMLKSIEISQADR
jgi:hypothetical protein